MRTKLLISIGLAVLWASGAQAAQITFGPSDQGITLVGDGANSVTVTTPSLTGSAFDTTNAEVGVFTISSAVETYTAGPSVDGLFTVDSNTGTFTYRNPDGDTFTVTWHFTVIQDNTPQPKFFGTGITTAISGDADFLAGFGPVGTTDAVDFITMPLSCAVPANCATLDQLATTTTSATAPISSGEIFPTILSTAATIATPEPTSLALMASALIGLGCLGRRRDRAVEKMQRPFKIS